jgi:hypothetical protein
MTGHDLAAAAAAAVASLGRDLGAQAVPDGTDPAQLLAPAAALRVARQVELAARAEVVVQVTSLARARERMLAAEHDLRLLLAYAREFAEPRPTGSTTWPARQACPSPESAPPTPATPQRSCVSLVAPLFAGDRGLPAGLRRPAWGAYARFLACHELISALVQCSR